MASPVLRVLAVLAVVAFAAGCSHATPQLVSVFSQVNRVWDPQDARWSPRLNVFVLATSADGHRVFDRLHLIHDDDPGQSLFLTLSRDQWVVVERSGEVWVGARNLTFPGDTVPTGPWRAQLVTRDGQRVEGTFSVPPTPLDAPAPRTTPVEVVAAGAQGRLRVTGWFEDYLVWARDSRGAVTTRAKTVGREFVVPEGSASFVLYTYDRARGEGLEAGPFPVQNGGASADR